MKSLREYFGRPASNPVGFVWDQSSDKPAATKVDFGFMGDTPSRNDLLYGREMTAFQKLRFHLLDPVIDRLEPLKNIYNRIAPSNIDQTLKYVTGAVGLAGAIMFTPQIQQYGADVDSLNDFKNKVMLLHGVKDAERQQIFYFYQDRPHMNPEQKESLHRTAKFLNMHPEINAELKPYTDIQDKQGGIVIMGATPVNEIKRALIEDFGVDEKQISEGSPIVNPEHKNAVRMVMRKAPGPQ